MAQLSSPGVAVTVIDESFYTPAAPGTTPLIIVASAEGKQNGSKTGTATGTLKAEAGMVKLLTSQKDLADTFGTPIFKTDANNNPVHAGEQNEYGLQAAYSYLGVSNRAYVVRADIDLAQLDAKADAPTGLPANNTYWLDTQATTFGIFQWNNASASTTGGQAFAVKYPIVITSAEANKLDEMSGAPKGSVGAVGDYLFDATSSPHKIWYKQANYTVDGNQHSGWVEVGSPDWVASWPTVVGSSFTTVGTGDGGDFSINGTNVTVNDGDTPADVADTINGLNIDNVAASVSNSKLELRVDDSTITITLADVDPNVLEAIGLVADEYNPPKLQISAHTQVPPFKTTNSYLGQATGSVWIKTTEPNLGARWRMKAYSSTSASWVAKSAPLYANNSEALAKLDPAGGGINLAKNALYVQYNSAEESPQMANFKVFLRSAVGATTIKTYAIESGTFSIGTYSFTMSESTKGETAMSDPITVEFEIVGTDPSVHGDAIAGAISGAGFENINAEFDSTTGIVTITHKLGGDIRIDDTGDQILSVLLGDATAIPSSAITHVYADPSDSINANKYLVSLWSSTVAGSVFYTASADAPSTTPATGQLWYNSIVDEVDIMVHDGDTWVGYLNADFGYGDGLTDPAGPFVQATEPTAADRTDGAEELAQGEIWIDTSDMENYPVIRKFNYQTKKWVLVDNSDQTTDEGIVFHDARWNTDGSENDATIVDLLSSNFLDFDAPDPALYPKGMLLWNLRRSGFNVKRYVHNYVDVQADNHRMPGSPSMANYYPNRWVSEAANQENGAGTFGRKAQRRVVVQALQALVNSNQQIRDEESRVFNLIACPGYPELIGEMISLNYDRGITAFVVGDTPPRLTPDATSLSNWGTNQKLAVEDNDDGLVSSDEYLGVFYPWGYTSDNIGNNIVVPPSHMMLRTIALSDNVSYPWFAPAGTRRGGITNATAVGYITDEGEFQSVALNNGQRDTLASIKVNPLTFITGTGLVNYGQYTRAKNASSLDRINVARLVIYLRRQFSQLAKPYVFEPNDKITRDEIKQAAESLLLELVGQRALYDYLVVCDESNNTPSRIDRSELYLDIAIEPVKAVEFIYIPLRLKNTGEIAGLGQ